jgi:hypothetical protein
VNKIPLPIPEAIITGGLGGLGTSLALALREREVPVTVIDVMHPGCAPYVVFAHRKALLEAAGVTVRLADMRDPDLPGQVLSFYPETDEHIPPFWIHCASPPPADVPDIPVDSYTDLSHTTPAMWIEVAMNRGWWYLVTQHLPAVLPNDPRMMYESWQAMLEAEGKLRQKYFPGVVQTGEPGLFPLLPSFFGKHQSPHTQPLRQYLQILAGREVSVCAFDKAYSVSLIEGIIIDLMQLLQTFASSKGFEVDIDLNPYPDLLGRSEDWLLYLRTILRLTHVQIRSDQGPGNYYTTDAYGHHLSQLPEFKGTGFAVLRADELRRVGEDDLKLLIENWNDLPWIPPGDWSKKISRGRGRRKRRS